MTASSNKHPELPQYSTSIADFDVTPYVFKVEELIKIVHYVVEGLLVNKIQDGCNLKGKQRNYFIIHTIAIIMVTNAMLSG
jgi:hypothetical protein